MNKIMAHMEDFRKDLMIYYKKLGLKTMDYSKSISELFFDMLKKMNLPYFENNNFPMGEGIYNNRQIEISPDRHYFGDDAPIFLNEFHDRRDVKLLLISIKMNCFIGNKKNFIFERIPFFSILYYYDNLKIKKTGIDSFDSKYAIDGYSWFNDFAKRYAISKIIELSLPKNKGFMIKFDKDMAYFSISPKGIDVGKLKKIIEFMYFLIEKLEEYKKLNPKNDEKEEKKAVLKNKIESIIIYFGIILFGILMLLSFLSSWGVL